MRWTSAPRHMVLAYMVLGCRPLNMLGLGRRFHVGGRDWCRLRERWRGRQSEYDRRCNDEFHKVLLLLRVTEEIGP